MATLRPLPDGRGYVLDYRVDGQRVRRHLVDVTPALAQRALETTRAKLALHKIGAQPFTSAFDDDTASLPISEAVEKYLKARKVDLAERTLQIHRYALTELESCFGRDAPVTDIPPDGYPTLTEHLRSRFDSTTSVNIYLRAIRTFFNWLITQQHIPGAPFAIRQLQQEKALPVFFTPVELERVYQHVTDPAMLSAFKFYEQTGLRLSEIHGSRVTDGYLRISDKKGKRERIYPVPISKETLAHYNRVKQAGYTSSAISHSFLKARRAAGITDRRKNIHALRHTFACRKLAETGNIYAVKELLGHTTVKTTEIYLNLPKGYLEEVFRSPKRETI